MDNDAVVLLSFGVLCLGLMIGGALNEGFFNYTTEYGQAICDETHPDITIEYNRDMSDKETIVCDKMPETKSYDGLQIQLEGD